MSLDMIDLFSGIGGIRIAFEENGVKCVASAEIDKYACETYQKNFKCNLVGDVSKLTKDNLPPFDILTAGFPCQPFSIGGLRKGFEDTRGTLFFEVARILQECQPKAFLLENVQGLVNHDGGQTLDVIEKTLTEVGYIFKWRVMNAKDYGIPQNRSRWYCIGFRNDLNIGFGNDGKDVIYNFPQECQLKTHIEDLLESNISLDYQISELARFNIDKYLPDFLAKHPSEHPMIANEIRASRCGFRNDGISPCLTAKMGTGGNNVPILVRENRKLTVRECLRIMGFPEWYNIDENSSHSYKQVGNSVVVPIISMLANEMVRVLTECDNKNSSK